MPDKYASMDSQLGYAECEVEDTEEMFWLRELDDYQSMVSLGNALAGQYRFQDADETLKQEAVWPCISYLAAWNDRNIRK